MAYLDAKKLKLKDPIIKTRLLLIELQLFVHLPAKLFITSLQKKNPNSITGHRIIDKHIFMHYIHQKKKNVKLLHILTIFFSNPCYTNQTYRKTLSRNYTPHDNT